MIEGRSTKVTNASLPLKQASAMLIRKAYVSVPAVLAKELLLFVNQNWQSESYAPGTLSGRLLFSVAFLLLIPLRVQFLQSLRIATHEEVLTRLSNCQDFLPNAVSRNVQTFNKRHFDNNAQNRSIRIAEEALPNKSNWLAFDSETGVFSFLRVFDKNNKDVTLMQLVWMNE